ncbi:addiction module protein [Scytonema hofmannii FACHB-248]|uniref:Addiction module protein n=1 Tax=Scytonema hofmannii FACHB-248 TaxID=1842502 RepID=A0ABR8GZG8_9CYAN|nr:addiction module protein [Scytonema hofmannii FACHB-248]
MIQKSNRIAISLPSASRALLAEKIVESLEFDTDPTIQAAWVTEAHKRRDTVSVLQAIAQILQSANLFQLLDKCAIIPDKTIKYLPSLL